MQHVILVFACLLIAAACREEVMHEPVTPGLEEEILLLVNAHREGKGLESLDHSSEATMEAEGHSSDMAAGRVAFGHDGFDGRFERLEQSTGASGAAENVARGQLDAGEVMQGWLDSPGHRENIEGDYTHLGVGIAENSDGVLFFTQIFLKID